jgi:hypothetical protein
MDLDLPPLPAGFATTRAGLHALAEHVLAPLRHRAEGRIGLRPHDGGFGPPLPDGRRVLAVGDRLIDGDRSTAITSLAAAAGFLGSELGAPTGIYEPTTDPDPERPLEVEREAAGILGRWFALGDELLAGLAASADEGDDPTEAQLWPEHFDLALAIGPEGQRANVGASPGDIDHDEPYLYVGPWEPRTGGVWNEPWGASLGYEAVREGADPAAFIHEVRTSMGWV